MSGSGGEIGTRNRARDWQMGEGMGLGDVLAGGERDRDKDKDKDMGRG